MSACQPTVQFMHINDQKTKYMIFNFCNAKKIQTRLYIENTLLEQVHETRLLGVILSDDLSWHSNTNSLVKRAYARMTILKKLYDFKLPKSQLLQIYMTYIRSVTEQSSVVWSSSITGIRGLREDQKSCPQNYLPKRLYFI